MKQMIYDCDNTMGLSQRDIDDGLTILYLLGRPDVDLAGITTTFGNDEIGVVYDNTKFINTHVVPWIEFMKEVFEIRGFYNWDMVAAVYATHPHLFKDNRFRTNSSVSDLQSGFLRKSMDEDTGCELNLPTDILDLDAFNEVVFDAWKKVKIPEQ